MTPLYPALEPYQHGILEAGDRNLVYWEMCGNPNGKPAMVIHGGPGSGCTPWHRRLFDPERYRVVLFDQRGCGRSRLHASSIDTDLSSNTTSNLVADIERLRRHLEIERWRLLGGSWGSTLALAYAEAHPERVSEIVLWGVTTGRRVEFDWLFRGGISILFPAEWQRLRDGLPESLRNNDVVEAYSNLLGDRDPAVRRAAATNWCLWESATPAWPPQSGLAPRFQNPQYAIAFARLVTHYVRHNGFLEDGVLIRGAAALAGIPGVMISGRFDFQAPLGWAFELKRAWPRADRVIVDNAGHDPSHEGITREIVRATDRFVL